MGLEKDKETCLVIGGNLAMNYAMYFLKKIKISIEISTVKDINAARVKVKKTAANDIRIVMRNMRFNQP